MPLVEPVIAHVRSLAVRHDGARVDAPADASFDIAPGEVVLLLGPSGSGKSTVTLTLNGLIPHAVPATVRGTVSIAGMDATTTPVATLSTHVGMVFQDPDAQLVTGTLLDEVAFGPENLRLPVDEVLRRTEAALRRVGLWERRHENPDRLSGGGRQRLALACALALGSPLLVLDEPTANLDPQGIEEVYAALGELVAAGDRAVLLVEHNLDAAVAITDRVVVLDAAGRTLAAGGVDEVLRERAAELHALGVWLPVATLAALRLQRRGRRFDRLPLTPDELRAELAAAAGGFSSGPQADVARTPPIRRRMGASGPDSASSASDRRSSGAPVAAPPEADAPPAVEVRDLTVRRGRADVLHDVSLRVDAGEFVAVVGANGAGKTTLLQAIGGVVPVPRGAVRTAGVDPSRADRRSRAAHVGFVFQNPEHQFIAHTVFDELAHGLRLQRMPDAEVRARVDELLERFGLTGHADSHPFLLSGGQKRRLSVGTALIAGAPVLALDEPTFGQDRARADELLRLLVDLNDGGTTILIVTHDMQLVADYARRVIVVEQGRIAADAPTAEVFADDELLRRCGLRPPPLSRGLAGIPGLEGVTRLDDLDDLDVLDVLDDEGAS
ncbi:ABC transporter ATP-binding protein [Microbacterium sp. No. 7]|uniref:ABC transporter ATP-binding protein n=1 Tax=Microbacterium sp. No. 7 TaxID=1714373 RepID=UPI0006D2986F|nr:ABC transporter ATP-binding protein [Microbacterium sp. No. 7]ALJ22244.1 ABC transporter ATP-binding protein [Microbacterium sp. No. 7]